MRRRSKIEQKGDAGMTEIMKGVSGQTSAPSRIQSLTP